ncbi:c-type cytochrome [Bradyrhizobium canariense]|uniref:Cytochrome c553 n=1 Tax=Bradyrhizobium canariense TaxID=255045 RepID=A0A1H2BU54_9BRAD|nr:c-type cytochrome [Bradyrhizobium canariense]SDT61459.1 Cytochrome c553 [Bradyrhizobium canariense]
MKKPMGFAFGALAVFAIVFCGAAMAQNSGSASQPTAASDSFPAWAYPWAPDFKAPLDDGIPRHVPDSAASFTVTQERDLFFAPDWHPDDHPPMPAVVASGRKPEVRACGSCHRVEGTGGPENVALAGLPESYIIQQMADYKSGARKFAGPQRSPVVLMTAIAKAATDAEVKAAAAYFASLKPKQTIRVVEADTVPVTQIARVFYMTVKDGGTEPIGRRIVEVPVDVAQFEHRDPRAQFTAYVPTGSIAKGETLAKTGGSGRTIACAGCHGPTLRGIGAIPAIAGRSLSYLVRQMYDFQQHARQGSAGEMMMPVVEKLSQDDMIALAAYVSSLQP